MQDRIGGADRKADVAVLTTGGTIDKVYFDQASDYEVGQSVVSDLIKRANVTLQVEVRELMRKDSLELTDQDRRIIRDEVERSTAPRIIVTHGTDTMAKTARALRGMPRKVIVLTGAFAPARFGETDAVFNVGMAFGAVQALPEGVYIVMNGRIFPNGEARKDRQRECFTATRQ